MEETIRPKIWKFNRFTSNPLNFQAKSGGLMVTGGDGIINRRRRYGIEGPVYLTAKGEKGAGVWYVDEEKQQIVKMDGSLSYSVLQTVSIHMEVVEPQPNRPKLQLTLL